MSKSVRGFKWLVGGIVGVSMLGACGAPEELETASEQSAQATGEVAVSLSVSKASLSAHEDVSVTVTLTNVSSQPVRLLKFYIPDGRLKEGLFEVTRNGEPVEYIGPHIKRAAPTAQDYVTLAPGESLSGSAPVSGMYDLSETGAYTVQYAARSLDQHSAVITKAAQLDSNLVSLWIEGRANEFEAQGTVSAQGLSYSGACTSTEQSSISSAMSSARTYANNASTYLNGISSGTTRYTTWFGAYSSTNLTTARNHFTNIKNALANAAVVVDCSCNDSYYAYVYPASPYKIYVCNAFWSAPMTGTDSKAGTLVHEMSHFNVVAATDDHAYGQSAAKSLAISSPTRALDNADSHEYFAENTPSLP
ncbi:peptidyl-Lys metalloendopeptidase [Archangium gephyra]|uniref:Extracellular protease n=1 Tax=Archangium gephyra TaxID=48 RepID=A0AAC8Q9G3_9BACT|nr:M35 family metallo-endopeptidase [Archangium gephyra]AKJ03535.1 Extracellular protease precursor [Archangium gephyra]REG22680.1 peptidyl-Lys metalloendopeptidase [Archangium gephyra]